MFAIHSNMYVIGRKYEVCDVCVAFSSLTSEYFVLSDASVNYCCLHCVCQPTGVTTKDALLEFAVKHYSTGSVIHCLYCSVFSHQLLL